MKFFYVLDCAGKAVAATALSPAPIASLKKFSVSPKAVSRFACHRSPKSPPEVGR